MLGRRVDLATLANGGDIAECSDMFYSDARQVLYPGVARSMSEGWETARRRTAAAMGVGAYVAIVVVNFAYLYPVLAAQTLPYDAWRDRMWFTSWI